MVKSFKTVPTANDTTADEGKKSVLSAPRSKKTYIFLALCAFVFLTSFGCGAWFFGFIPRPQKDHIIHSESSPIFIPVPEIIANLDSNNGQDSYIKIKIFIQVKSSGDANCVRFDMPKLIDMFQTYLRSMHINELHGAVGTYRLKEALLHRAYVVAAPIRIENILFEKLIVQ